MLRERLQAIQTLCFAESAPQEVLAALEDTERWLLYREMVRGHFLNVVEAALPRTTAAWGKSHVERAVSDWLNASGARARFFRALPEEFASYALQNSSLGEPAWLRDLLRYEVACWSALHRQDLSQTPVEIDFNLPVALNSTCALLQLAYSVHEKKESLEPPTKRVVYVCVFRGADARISTWELNQVAFELVQAWQDAGKTLKEQVEGVAQKQSILIDESFVEKLSGMLADFIERGIVLGSLKR